MPIRDIRRYRHPADQGHRFRPLARDGWEIPIPGRVQDLDGWRDGVSDVVVGTAENEDYAYFCGITVGVAEPFHIPDTHLLQIGEFDFARVVLGASLLLSMFSSSTTGGREWSATLRMLMDRGARLDDSRTLYATRRVRIHYHVVY